MYSQAPSAKGFAVALVALLAAACSAATIQQSPDAVEGRRVYLGRSDPISVVPEQLDLGRTDCVHIWVDGGGRSPQLYDELDALMRGYGLREVGIRNPGPTLDGGSGNIATYFRDPVELLGCGASHAEICGLLWQEGIANVWNIGMGMSCYVSRSQAERALKVLGPSGVLGHYDVDVRVN